MTDAEGINKESRIGEFYEKENQNDTYNGYPGCGDMPYRNA